MEAWDWDLVSRNDFLGQSECPAPSRPPLLASVPAVPSHSRALRGLGSPGAQEDLSRYPSPRNSGWQGRETRIPALGRPPLPYQQPCGLSRSQVVVNVQRLWAARRRRAGSGCSLTSPRAGGKSECLGLGRRGVGSGPWEAEPRLQQAGRCAGWG